jgi:hypothetical protein
LREETGALDERDNPRYNANVMNTAIEQTEDLLALYRRAFEEFGARALWNVRELESPSPEDALAITCSLRIEGDLKARRLAEQIEKAYRAAV